MSNAGSARDSLRGPRRDAPGADEHLVDMAAVAEAAAERQDLADALAAIAQVVDEESVDTTLQRVADLAVRAIPDCDAAGVTVVEGERFVTAAYTDERVLPVDRGQYELGDGPCLEAIRTVRVNHVAVDEARARWPSFAADAESVGIRSFLAAPLVLRGRAIGALNLYSREARGFDALDEVFIGLFTGQAAVAVANAQLYRDARLLADQLTAAMVSRAVIEQAKGVLMTQRRIGADEAFDVLRKLSQDRNVKLRDVAHEIVQEVGAEG